MSIVQCYDYPSSEVQRGNRMVEEKEIINNEINMEEKQQMNKLPINLLQGPSNYRKMIITNGKSRRKDCQEEIDYFSNSLEFINDPIFDSFQKKAHYKNSVKNNNQNTSSTRKEDAQSFSENISSHKKKTSTYLPSSKKQSNKISEKIKRQLKTKSKAKQKSLSKKKKKKIITSKQIIAINDKIDFNKSRSSNSYLSEKRFNMPDLIYSSLIHFEEEKRERKIMEIMRKQKSLQKTDKLKEFSQEVRNFNKNNFPQKIQRPQSAPSKRELAKQYWQNVSVFITKQLKRDISQGYSKNIVEYLKNSLKTDKQCRNHSPQILAQNMVLMRQKNGEKAMKKILLQQKVKNFKKNKVKRQLQMLELWQNKNRRKCSKRKFSPTSKQIQQAFQNIIQEEQQIKEKRVKKQKK